MHTLRKYRTTQPCSQPVFSFIMSPIPVRCLRSHDITTSQMFHQHVNLEKMRAASTRPSPALLKAQWIFSVHNTLPAQQARAGHSTDCGELQGRGVKPSSYRQHQADEDHSSSTRQLSSLHSAQNPPDATALGFTGSIAPTLSPVRSPLFQSTRAHHQPCPDMHSLHTEKPESRSLGVYFRKIICWHGGCR